MALDKAIEHGKEKRRQYRLAARWDRTCRPGGGCPYCRGNRTHARLKREQSANEQIEEVLHED